MTEEQIRADERRRWAKVAFMLMLEAKLRAQDDPSFELLWKTFTVFATRLLDNDAPTDGDMAALSKRLHDAGLKIGDAGGSAV